MKVNGAVLAKKWSLNVAQARYSKWGNWYAPLTAYPAALLDTNGYILIPDQSYLHNHPDIKVTKQINIPNLISTLHEYVRVVGHLAEEFSDDLLIPEGMRVNISVNRYERSARARKECIEHYGYVCSVCNHSMVEYYGNLAGSLIHIHHLVPVSEIGERYSLNPITDLRPVCPNCHAFLHLSSPPMSIEEAQRIFKDISEQ